MLSSASAMGLVHSKDGIFFYLSNIGKTYFDPDSESYYGGVFDALIEQNELMNYSTVEKSLLSNKAQVSGGVDLFSNTEGYGNSEYFVKALHQKSLNAALSWTNKFSLNQYSKLIDLGGGSGVHSIAACKRNPNLRSLVCDRKPVLYETKKYIDKHLLSDRIETKEIDLWKDDFPIGDAHFFGDIFHDWTPEKCEILARKSYENLIENGVILIHEMLFNSTKTGPLLSAAYNMKMQLWTEGQQFSFKEIKHILIKAGFKRINYINSFGNWSLITGKKI
ncbi:MAG: 3-hydroxy-5-methyl-1-naphthoate 3-O-methyltransferase [Chlamydiae bacterium]|nr:3-hydroxy-5-methyl-1-naphthoate 3-O-methyltransferase [Chlamydiota bacterium]